MVTLPVNSDESSSGELTHVWVFMAGALHATDGIFEMSNKGPKTVLYILSCDLESNETMLFSVFECSFLKYTAPD